MDPQSLLLLDALLARRRLLFEELFGVDQTTAGRLSYPGRGTLDYSVSALISEMPFSLVGRLVEKDRSARRDSAVLEGARWYAECSTLR
jgi:hypothetical protein